ncbi:hypothetical protein K458DRAFT_422214 [Lentithecium fluviatile CBS 122367]|uniref:RWD domain-containing protein n=1 Tax=Lentithecium fluviatile CBS 122367 TaxID=1168545 RepID=A0A6G1IN23_9PLEO|nr:hypothetical protein K458DRAFT_422214 [Lentithecium fluviatile CBS 122367]
MSQADESRLALELELIQAMYPDQVEYDVGSRDLKFSEQAALLHLRLPERYPDAGFPEVVAARDGAKNDLRDRTKEAVRAAGLAECEEALDAIIACFQRIVEETNRARNSQTGTESTSSAPEASKTVIIWLHHLLALTKRKLALSPTSIAGIIKPGYPGVMIFSGLASAVANHVNTLKAENWQAFQVRYEGDELWEFAHGSGIKEVETMAEIVKEVEAGNNGAKQKQDFLKAVGIK